MERRRFLQNIGATAVGFSLFKASMAAQLPASAAAVGD